MTDYNTVFGSLLPLLLTVLTISGARVGEPINVGTTLYGKRDLTKYWTEQEASGLQCRAIVDQLLPRRVPGGAAFFSYVKLIVDQSEIIDSGKSRRRTMVAVADAIGGYMFGVLLPKIKRSYYEGREPYNVTNRLYGIMRKIKFILNTDGRGWITAAEVEAEAEADTVPSAQDDDFDDVRDVVEDPCAGLHLQEEPPDSGECAPVPTPAFDDDLRPGSVAVPFAAGKRLFSVDGPPAAADGDVPMLVQYYRLAVGCTAAAPNRFLRDVRDWLDSAVVPLLSSHRRWYPALAGASRVARAATRASAKASAKASAGDGDGGVRTKRRAIPRPAPVPTSTASDADDWPGCDDEPSGQLPNSNVFLLVFLLSLTFTWLCFGMLAIHEGIRNVVDCLTTPKPSPPPRSYRNLV